MSGVKTSQTFCKLLFLPSFQAVLLGISTLSCFSTTTFPATTPAFGWPCAPFSAERSAFSLAATCQTWPYELWDSIPDSGFCPLLPLWQRPSASVSSPWIHPTHLPSSYSTTSSVGLYILATLCFSVHFWANISPKNEWKSRRLISLKIYILICKLLLFCR